MLSQSRGDSIDVRIGFRYLTNGELDTSFGDNGIVLTELGGEYINVFSSVVENNGIIYLLVKYDWAPDSFLQVIKYVENGGLDLSFGDNGILSIDSSSNYYSGAISIQNESKLLISYSDPLYNEYKLTQYLTNGIIDSSFGNNGVVNIDIDNFSPKKFLFQNDNKVIIYGEILEFEGTRFCLTRYLNNGSLDLSFGDNGVASESFEGVAVIFQDNGKVLGVGNTYWFNGDENFVFARFNNTPLGIEDLQLKNVSIYPNPSNGVFKIQHDYLAIETPYQISDITGKLIQTGKLSGEQTYVDLTQVQQGIYFLIATGSTYKLVKN